MEQAIINYVKEYIPELGDRMMPVFSYVLDGISIAYTTTPVSGGHVKQSQLELKILHRDYDVCKEMEDRVKGLLDMEEDNPFVTYGGIRFHSQIAGGGLLFNEGCQMFEDTLYFMIDWRKINVI